jgi:hypothetical protein
MRRPAALNEKTNRERENWKFEKLWTNTRHGEREFSQPSHHPSPEVQENETVDESGSDVMRRDATPTGK